MERLLQSASLQTYTIVKSNNRILQYSIIKRTSRILQCSCKHILKSEVPNVFSSALIILWSQGATIYCSILANIYYNQMEQPYSAILQTHTVVKWSNRCRSQTYKHTCIVKIGNCIQPLFCIVNINERACKH